MIVVVDASVALRWFFRLRDDEADMERALLLLGDIDAGRAHMVQPPHFLAEMGAVLAREKPAEAQADLADLLLLEFSHIAIRLSMPRRWIWHAGWGITCSIPFITPPPCT